VVTTDRLLNGRRVPGTKGSRTTKVQLFRNMVEERKGVEENPQGNQKVNSSWTRGGARRRSRSKADSGGVLEKTTWVGRSGQSQGEETFKGLKTVAERNQEGERHRQNQNITSNREWDGRLGPDRQGWGPITLSETARRQAGTEKRKRQV